VNAARLLGAATVFLGAIIIGFNPNWDPVLLGLPRGGHGLHVTDLIGMAVVTVGVVVLWRAPAP